MRVKERRQSRTKKEMEKKKKRLRFGSIKKSGRTLTKKNSNSPLSNLFSLKNHHPKAIQEQVKFTIQWLSPRESWGKVKIYIGRARIYSRLWLAILLWNCRRNVGVRLVEVRRKVLNQETSEKNRIFWLVYLAETHAWFMTQNFLLKALRISKVWIYPSHQLNETLYHRRTDRHWQNL